MIQKETISKLQTIAFRKYNYLKCLRKCKGQTLYMYGMKRNYAAETTLECKVLVQKDTLQNVS